MAAVRLLTAGLLAVWVAGLSAGRATAGPPPKVALPAWVRQSAASPIAARVSSKSARSLAATAARVRTVIDAAAAGAPPAELARHGVGAATSATKLYLDNLRRLRGGELSPQHLAALKLLVAVDRVLAAYDLMNGVPPHQVARGIGQSTVAYAAGSAATAGMMWVAGTFGTASTGTAIASLSGAAYTSAATAWWGGGSLAAGGLGMAGGTAVMTGGAILLAVGAGYAIDKGIDYLDPAERDGLNLLVAGVLKRPDLTDSATPHGAALLEAARQLDAAERALGR